MRIAFDGTALRPFRTGVGYYTEHLLHHLAQLTTSDELFVVSNDVVDTTVPLPPNVHVIRPPRRVPRIVWLQTGARAAVDRLHADIVHFTNGIVPIALASPAVVTIHDMSLQLYARYHPMRRVILNRPLVNLAARRAAALITVSESSKRDILKLYGLDSDREHVIHEAAAPQFHPVRDPVRLEDVRRRYRLRERFILYVGTIEPRKNLPALVDAFATRLKSGALSHQLVCVGPYGWGSRGLGDHIRRANAADDINFTGYVPFADLPALYSLAEMFVYPSMYEGFGLPVVEAMACGVPVITGRATALAEVGGNAVEQVDRLEASALGDAMVKLAHDGKLRQELAARGLDRAASFSWRRAARETLDLYRQAAAQPIPSVPGRSRRTNGVAPARTAGIAAVDVLFGQAYFLRFDPKLWNAQQPYAPLGTLYAAASTRAAGYTVALFDAMLATSEDEWAAALDKHRPRIAVLYEDNFNYLTKMCLLRMRHAALRMIAAARDRHVPVVVAGSDATDNPSIYIDAGAELVIVGEGEATLSEVLGVLTGKRSVCLEDVNGVCIRNRQGQLLRTPQRSVVRDLDSLPFPAWDLVDIPRYRRVWERRHGYYSMNLVTTRGCPFHCNWCAKPIYGQRYSARTAGNVVAELLWLKRAYSPDHVWIADDIFGLKPGWIEEFARLVEERGAAVRFKCLLRADQVTARVATALRAAGCQTAWIGAESGSQRILDAMEKGTRVEQIHDATRLLHGVGIEVGFFLQFGYPSETREDIDLTLEMVRTCRPDDIGVSVSYPLPGTTFYQRVNAQLGEKRNWVDSSDLAMMYRATHVPDFYRALHALVHTEFRARRAAEEMRRALTAPATLGARHVRASIAHVTYRLRLMRLRRQIAHLAAETPPRPAIVTVPVLTPQAAAVPSEQSR